MKPTLLLSLLPTLALAHPEDGKAPGNDIDSPVRTGNGTWTYEAVPHWGKMPGDKNLGPTHGGVVVDNKTGNVYVSTDADHAIVVFDNDGKHLKNIAPECKGFHAMAIAEEDGNTVLFGAQLGGPNPLRVCKLDTSGKLLLSISAKEYPELKGGWKGLTAVTVAPDGSIFCSMGYGAQFIHKFDASGKHLKTFGGRGKGEQVLTNTSHGLAVDTRYEEPRLLICDRENRRLIHTDLEGNWIGEYATKLRRPCAASILGDHCAIAELEGRVDLEPGVDALCLTHGALEGSDPGPASGQDHSNRTFLMDYQPVEPITDHRGQNTHIQDIRAHHKQSAILK